MISGTTREAYNGFNACFFGKKNRVFEVSVVHLSSSLIRMNGVSVSGECCDFDAVLFEGVHPFFKSLFVVEEDIGVSVILSGITAAAYFNSFNAVAL